jgi:hypothetical protein
MFRMSDARPVFVLRIAGKPGTDGIHKLRAALKSLRRLGFRALDVREEEQTRSKEFQLTTERSEITP